MAKRSSKKGGRGGRHSRMTLLERYEAAVEIQRQEALQRKEARKEEKRRAKQEAKKAKKDLRRQRLQQQLAERKERRLQRRRRLETRRALRSSSENKLQKLLDVFLPPKKLATAAASEARASKTPPVLPAAARGVLSDESDDGENEEEQDLSSSDKEPSLAEEVEGDATATKPLKRRRESADSPGENCAPSNVFSEEAGDSEKEEDDSSASLFRSPFLLEEFGLEQTAARLRQAVKALAETTESASAKPEDATGPSPLDFTDSFFEEVDDAALQVRRAFLEKRREAAGEGGPGARTRRTQKTEKLSSHVEAFVEALAGTAFCPVGGALGKQAGESGGRLCRRTLQVPGFAPFAAALSKEAPRLPHRRRLSESAKEGQEREGGGGKLETFLEGVLHLEIPRDVFHVSTEASSSRSFSVDLYGQPASVAEGVRQILQEQSTADTVSASDFPLLQKAAQEGLLTSLHHFLRTYADVAFPHENAFTSNAVRAVLAGHALGHALKTRARSSSTSKLQPFLRDAAPSRRLHILQLLWKGASLRELLQRLRSEETPSTTPATETASVEAKEDWTSAVTERSESVPLTEEEANAWTEKLLADSGFTRPRVLALLPWRSAAKTFVEAMLKMLPSGMTVLQRDRFEKEFSLSQEESARQEASFQKAKRPRDFALTFRGNTDDDFKLGIKLAPKSFALFEAFETSDIIVASPLALRTLVGAAGEAGGRSEFLSSLEVILIDRADIIAQQNWQLLKEVLERCNRTPESYTDFDIGRLRPSMAAAIGCTDRQLVVCSSGRSGRFSALFETHSANFRGRLELFDPTLAAACMPLDVDVQNGGSGGGEGLSGVCCEESKKAPSVCESGMAAAEAPRGLVPASKQCTLAGVQQLFCRVACEDFTKIERALLKHFVEQVLPTLEGDFGSAVLVLPSYLEYCRRGATRRVVVFPLATAAFSGPTKVQSLRASECECRLWKPLRNSGVSFVACHEYTPNAKLTRARQQFIKGETPLLVTTGRFCFYRRYRLLGAKRIIFVGPPTSPEVYVHLLTQSLPAASHSPARVEGASLCFFTEFHLQQLEQLLPLHQTLQLLRAPCGRVVSVR